MAAALTQASKALRHWALDPPIALSPLDAGSVNRICRVQAGAGTFFLRTYRTADPAVVGREHALIAHMQVAGIPAVAPVAAHGGLTVVASGGALHALYPQAEGEPVAREHLMPTHAEAAGAMLARLHAAARRLPDAGYRRYRLAWDAEAWRARLHTIECAIVARADTTDTDHQALEHVRAQRCWLSDPRCAHSHVVLAPAQVTHGDYHDANLFFGPRGVSGIIDWEQAAWMPRAFEVVRAAAYMFDLQPALTQAFLRAYSAHSDLGPEELDDGARAWGVMSDHYVWAPEEVYLHGNERARRFLRQSPFRPFLDVWAEVQR
jgi:homoserine kinase type II